MTLIRQIYTDFYDVICHVELVETSHVTHVKNYMRPFDYAQGDRYICGYLVKSVSSVCHLNSHLSPTHFLEKPYFIPMYET